MKKIIILLMALMPCCATVTQAQGWWWWYLAQQNVQRAQEKREKREQQEREEAQKKAHEYAQKQKLVKKWQGRMGNVELPPPLVTVLKEDARAQQQRQVPRRENRQISLRTPQPRRVIVPKSAPTIGERELLAFAMVIDSLKRQIAEKEFKNSVLSARNDSLQDALTTTKSPFNSSQAHQEPEAVNGTPPNNISERELLAIATVIDSLKISLAEKELENSALSAKCDSLQVALVTAKILPTEVNEVWYQSNQAAVKEKAYAPIVKNVNLQPAEEESNTLAICFFVFVIGWILFWGIAIWPSSDEKSLSV